jgi:hypothetical protein
MDTVMPPLSARAAGSDAAAATNVRATATARAFMSGILPAFVRQYDGVTVYVMVVV